MAFRQVGRSPQKALPGEMLLVIRKSPRRIAQSRLRCHIGILHPTQARVLLAILSKGSFEVYNSIH